MMNFDGSLEQRMRLAAMTEGERAELLRQAEDELQRLKEGMPERTRELDDAVKRLDKAKAEAETLAAAVTEAAKALALLNSAAVAGALAFIQSLVTKGTFGDFKFFAVGAVVAFLVGALAASLTPRAVLNLKIKLLLPKARAEGSHDTTFFLRIATVGFGVGAVLFLWALIQL